MSDMTAQAIIEAAYRKNAIMTTSATQLNNGLTDLQNMLSSWSAEGLIVPSLVTENFTLITGQMTYTIGSGGDMDTVRPNSIMNAYIRISDNDYPVDVRMTRSQWVQILNKTHEEQPRRLYYDSAYPLGKIRFDVEAKTTYDFWLVSEKPLTNPTALATTFSVPLEFNNAMIYNLAITLAPDNDNKLPPEVFALAEKYLEAIDTNNIVERMGFKSAKSEIPAGFGRSSSMNIDRGY